MSDEWLAGIPPARPRLGGHGPADLQREAERVLLNRYAPPSVLVNEQFEIQHFRGRTSPFLETPTGQPTTNILRMAREGLFMELRSALAEAKATRVPIVREGLRVPDQGSDLPYTLRVLPVSPPGTQELSFLVLFEMTTLPWTREAKEPTPVSAAENDVEWLRRELALEQTVFANGRRSARRGGTGPPRRTRGGAVQQRGTQKHKRGVGDDEGGAAVGERRADDRQRAISDSQQRSQCPHG